MIRRPDSSSPTPLFPALALALPLAACGGDPDVMAEVVVDTLEGGAVHVSNPSTGLWGEGEGWELVEAVRVGSLDGDGPDVFGAINKLAVNSRGRVHVLDRQAEEIRVFDAQGAHVRTLGGTGSGPGELSRPFGLGVDGEDRVWAADAGNGRYTVWSPDGDLLATRDRPASAFGFSWTAGFDDDVLVEYTLVEVDPEAPVRDRRGFLRVPAEDGGVVDTLAGPEVEIDAPEPYELTNEDGMTLMSAAVPFSPSAHVAPTGDGAYWVGAGDAYELRRVSLAGDTARIVTRKHDPVPVTAEEAEEALGRDFFEQMRERGGEVDPGRIPEQKPAFQDVAEDDRGYLWTRLPTPHGEDRTGFDVFDPAGLYLGTVTAPDPVAAYPTPVIRGDRLWAVVDDDLDVPWVVGYRIEGR